MTPEKQLELERDEWRRVSRHLLDEIVKLNLQIIVLKEKENEQ